MSLTERVFTQTFAAGSGNIFREAYFAGFGEDDRTDPNPVLSLKDYKHGVEGCITN